jgi:DUF1680 family protein
MISYFLPMLPGAHKVYCTPERSFWCCVGTGFENQAKYAEAIYYHRDSELFVNLFIASELNWQEEGVTVLQETRFPQESTTSLRIGTQRDQRLTISIRYPSWAAAGALVTVNGDTIQVAQTPGSYIDLERLWRNGDRIEIDYPMELRLTPTENPDIAAVSYGPIVLAAKMGTEGMQEPAPYSDPTLHNDYYTYNYRVPPMLSNALQVKGRPVAQWLKPVAGQPLVFRTDPAVAGAEYTLVPLYDLHRERHIVYWELQ